MSRALVISGGGSKGAFAVGVIKRLLKEYPLLSFDSYVGTSTGSLIAPLAAMGAYDLLEELYTTIKTEDIINKSNLGDRLNQHSIFDANPLWQLIEQYYNDDNYDILQASGKKIFLTTTCLQTSELVVFTNHPNPAVPKHYEVKTVVNADHFRKAVMASACQPVFMPPIKVNLKIPGEANPHYQFVDGGVREYAGIQMAIDNGDSEIFTILLSTGQKVLLDTEFKTIFPILQQTIDIFTEDVGKNDLIVPGQYNEALQYIEAVKNKMKKAGVDPAKVDDYFRVKGNGNPFEDKTPLKLFTFRPDKPLGGGPGGLTFDSAEMKRMIAAGQKVGNDFIASLEPGDITWA
ncbi:MAG: patatin-like phospholipase family protein [Gloeobacteraceae cyanobacterium ES-bin-316]|nr:patatin-like phospholipase family protein [Ferruginibacter sp.]